MTSILPTLYQALHQKYNDRKRGMECHISDIAICTREAAFRRLEPQPIDNTQLGFFVFGESAGSAIQALVDSDPERFKAEYEVIWEGIHAHIDLFDLKNRIPIEIKTANIPDMEQPKSHYLSQLHKYMAMTGAHTGIILVFLTQHFRGKKRGQPFREWIITLSNEQLQATRESMIAQRTAFEKALIEKNPLLAPGVLKDKELNWKCTYCHWVNDCQQHAKTESDIP